MVAVLGQMSPVPDPLDFDPTVEGGYAAPLPGPVVLGQAPVVVPAPAPAAPAGRSGLDYATFGLAGALGRGLERFITSDSGGAAAPAAAPAVAPRATGVGVLPAEQLPQSFTGIGAQFAPPASPATGPAAAQAPAAAPAAPAPRGAAPGAAGGVPDTFMGVDLRPAKAAAAGLDAGMRGATEVERIQVGGLTGEAKALKEQRARAEGELAQALANVEGVQAAERATAAETQRLAGEKAEAARVAEEDAAIERETRRQAAADAARKLEAAQNALDNTKIDVDKAYGGAGGRIFAGLAVALGSFGASLTGGPNYAMQLVDSRINRELDAQRSELDKAKGKVTELGRLLQRNEDVLGDATKARTLARAQTFEALAKDIEARKVGGELTARQAQVRDDLKARAAAEMDKLSAGIRETETKAALVPALGRQQRAAATAAVTREANKEERAFRRQAVLKLIDQGQLTLDPQTGAIVQGTGTPEQQEKLITRTTNHFKLLDDRNLITGPESMTNLMRLVGVDPITGAKSSSGSVAGYSFGGTFKDPFNVTYQAKEIQRQVIEQVENTAKASGGVITDSDREGALRRIRGSGTVGELQNALVDFYGKYASKARAIASTDPQAFQIIAKTNPALAAVVDFGQAKQAATAIGGRPGAK